MFVFTVIYVFRHYPSCLMFMNVFGTNTIEKQRGSRWTRARRTDGTQQSLGTKEREEERLVAETTGTNLRLLSANAT